MKVLTVEEALSNEKWKISEDTYSRFDIELKEYIRKVNNSIGESEEHLKNYFAEFLKKGVFFNPIYTINTHSRVDLVIKTQNDINVIIETKNPKNSGEMIKPENANKKSFHEIVLYYLELTRTVNNGTIIKNFTSTVRNIIVTDMNKVAIIDSHNLESIVNDKIEKDYLKFKQGLLLDNRNETFYSLLSQRYDELNIASKLQFVWLDIRELSRRKKDITLLYKIFSREYLLKENNVFLDKTHELNSRFYKELLYIMGMKEVKDKSNYYIVLDGSNSFSLCSQIFSILVEEKDFSKEDAENAAFELSIIWMNRLLFIKLFEGQLITFNGMSQDYKILDSEKIRNFKDLYNLFFNVLGQKPESRDTVSNASFVNLFKKIPYLNSSLFEKQQIEIDCINISNLSNEYIDIIPGSVIKGSKNIRILDYIISFLNSYNFTTINDNTHRDIIDASVLGLIFEKINGYKDGSFYTPSYITEYMSKVTIESLVLDKVNAFYRTNIKNIDDLIDYIDDSEKRKQVNELIDSLKICDPAVGSGHFLVSVLNRILALKSELGVLYKVDGKRLKEYSLEIYDDTLYVYDGQHNLFTYDKNSFESNIIQKTLFVEKRKIIENVLFGVDLNKNAAAICRLRLWIELLKNAYYENNIMETLPNIDIDIKVGNSLIAKAQPKIGEKITSIDERQKKIITKYKKLVQQYKNVSDKYIKRQIVSDLEFQKSLLHDRIRQFSIFDGEENNKNFYKYAFEWMLEFPEVLKENGVFEGFDCVIGNPPYGVKLDEKEKKYYKNEFSDVHYRTPDTYLYFISNSFRILKKNGYLSFIVPNNLLYQNDDLYARKLIISKNIKRVINLGDNVFDSANVPTAIFVCKNGASTDLKYSYNDIRNIPREQKKNYIDKIDFYGNTNLLENVPDNVFGMDDDAIKIYKKIMSKSTLIDIEALEVASGISSGNNSAYIVSKNEINEEHLEREYIKPLIVGSDIEKYVIAKNDSNIIYLPKNINQDSIPYILNRLERYKGDLEKRSEVKAHKMTWWSMNRPRDERHFNQSKIVLRQTSDHIVAALDENNNYPLDSLIYLLLSDTTMLLDVVGVLNTKIIDYIYKKVSQEEGRTFAQVKPKNVRKLPIPNKIKDLNIGDIVKKIMSFKKNSQDTKELEEQIENILKKYYELTKEEVAIIYKN